MQDYEFGGSWIPDGFQLKKIRRPAKHVPAWANNDTKLRMRIFGPAIRRYRIAYLYWRCGWNAREVAEEIKIKEQSVKDVIHQLVAGSRVG